MLVLVSLYIQIRQEQQNTHQFAKIEAEASYKKDILYQKWVAMHGGIYVPATQFKKPNLETDQNKLHDITLSNGEKLTLMSPLNMICQVHELAKQDYDLKGHIASLTPLQPENEPDAWEKKVLNMFEHGKNEYWGIDSIDGKEYIRYMKVLELENPGVEYYAGGISKVADIKEGISESVPTAYYDNIAKASILDSIYIYGIIYMVIVSLGTYYYKNLEKHINMRYVMQNKLERNEANLRIQNEELKNAKETAEEGNRLKTAFLHNLSHEVRTPMNSIIGFSQILSEPNLTREKHIKFSQIVNESANNLLAIIDDVLAISTIETNQSPLIITTFNVQSIFKEISGRFRKKCKEKKLEFIINIDVPGESFTFESDRDKLTDILIHLTNNALKFTHKGSIELGCKNTDDGLYFYVKDTGIGIQTDYQLSIFQPFIKADETAEESFNGTGLGLSIAQGYASLLKSRIMVESELGKGSCFYFSITSKF